MFKIYEELTKALEENVTLLQSVEIQSREYDHRLNVISQLAGVLNDLKCAPNRETTVTGFTEPEGKDSPTQKRTRKKKETKKEEEEAVAEDLNPSDADTETHEEETPTPTEIPTETQEKAIEITTVRRALAKAAKAGIDVQKFLREKGFEKLSEAPTASYKELYDGVTALMEAE